MLVVGATKQDRNETLASFRDELLIAGPIALVLASLVGYLLAGVSLRQVDSMRRRAAAISEETPGERLPVPPTGDERGTSSPTPVTSCERRLRSSARSSSSHFDRRTQPRSSGRRFAGPRERSIGLPSSPRTSC